MASIKCPFCEKRYVSMEATEDHMNKVHTAQIPEEISAAQILFNIKNRSDPFKKFGTSVILKLPTKFNNQTKRYERFATNKEVEMYKKQFTERMMKTYGKTHLLDDPDVQRKMLSNRKISDKFKMQDGTLIEYTGTYEKDFLYFLDSVFQWSPTDLISPAPVNITYLDPMTNRNRIYIPDFFIPSLNLLIEIKASDNMHYRERDLPKEKAKDAAATKSKYNYLKILDKDYQDFMEMLFNLRGDIDME